MVTCCTFSDCTYSIHTPITAILSLLCCHWHHRHPLTTAISTTVAYSRSMSLSFVWTAVVVVVRSNRWLSRFVHVRGPWSIWMTITGNNRQASVIAQTLVYAHTSPNKREYLYYCNRHPRQNVPRGSKLRWRGKPIVWAPPSSLSLQFSLSLLSSSSMY